MTARAFALCLLVLALDARAAGAPRYALRYDEATRSMQVEACLDAAAAQVRFAGDGSATRSLARFARTGGGAIAREGAAWVARDWRAGECLHYRADLGALAAAQPRRGIDARGDALVSDPASWLLEPDDADDVLVRVELPDGVALSAPWVPLAPGDGAARYRIPRTPDAWMGRIALGRFQTRALRLPGGTLHVALLGHPDATQRERLLAWLGRVGDVAVRAFGRLPIGDVQVLVAPVGAQRDAVVFGQSLRGQGNGLTLFVDVAQPSSAFEQDWIAPHELSHLFHPSLGERGAWLAEGLATYYQNVLRARAGLMSPEHAWRAFEAGFARGRDASRGSALPTLEAASTRMGEDRAYMRVYWSGAAFWLGAELEWRRRGLPALDARLQAFAQCCLDPPRSWTPRDFVGRLDRLGGGDVLAPMFESWRVRTDFPRTDALHAALGLRHAGDALRLDDGAAFRQLREAIMHPSASASR
ncbi:MAG: hypothetical protein EOP90_03970 [Lysobacteraceae bacterium]|nr:MAG: hypothetical protein EOP90_03970 [Xanthomonadaceae bacterium]